MGESPGASKEQAKMMKWMMPIMFTIFFKDFPSGVVLYWLVFNVLTGLQQMLITRKRRAQEVEEKPK